MWVSANRASRVLYNFLVTLNKKIVFIIPANICPVVLATFIKAKVQYQLVDIDRRTLCADIQLIKAVLAKGELAYGLLFVRTFGSLLVRDAELVDLKEGFKNLEVVIDDRCLCIPELDATKFSKAIDLTLFSTGYSKFVELGYGGFGWLSSQNKIKYKAPVLEFNETSHEKLVDDFNHAISKRIKFQYSHDDWLDNRELPLPLSDYFNLIDNKIKESLAHKQSINNIYRRIISSEFWLGEEFDMWRFSILVKNKTKVIDEIFSNDLFASSHYSSMAGIFDDGKAQIASEVHSKIVNLFNDYRFAIEMAIRVATIVNDEARK